jgi:hypothetical protein
MKDSIPIVGVPGDFVSQTDENLFAFVNTLRLSVKARVAEEQRRGLSLSEIVAQVREMVRVAERDAEQSKLFPSHAFRAIQRQAIAWCIESFQPLAITAGNDFCAPPNGSDQQSLPPVLVPGGPFAARVSAQSPNSRGLP